MNRGRFFIGMILMLVVVAFVLGFVLRGGNDEFTQLRLERAQTRQAYQLVNIAIVQIIIMIAEIGAVVMIGYVAFYLIAIARNWLDTRARLIHAADGVFPLVRANNGQIYDPNRNAGDNPYVTLAALQVQNTAAIPRNVTTAPRALPAAQALPAAAQNDMPAELPRLVDLAQICPQPSLDKLVLGVGTSGTITASLGGLMHTLAIGASGFGKSAFLRGLIWQLAQVSDPVGIVAIDTSGSEFNIIRSWDKLLYPVARDNETAIATLQAVSAEIAKRKQLYEQHPTAYDLDSYNQMATSKLSPILVMIDEGTHLLNQAGTSEILREVTQTARQYGIYLLLSGQSAHSKVIDTQTRDNFSTRLCLHTSKSSYRVVLGESVEDVVQPGRAHVQLTGELLQQIQTPLVSREALQHVLTTGTSSPTPAPIQDIAQVDVIEDDPGMNEAERIRLLHSQGLSLAAIQRRVFGHTGGAFYTKVKQAIS